MRAMVIDSGARGQAIAHKLYEEGIEVVVSPGNPGNEEIAYSTDTEATDVAGQLVNAHKYGIDLTIVGSDDALAGGIVDAFQSEGRLIFGPTKNQSRAEWDRSYAKNLSKEIDVPIGGYEEFTELRAGLTYLESHNQWPVYIKDNYLAQGKGAKECGNLEEAERCMKSLAKFVIEDYIYGPEASLHAFCDGANILTIPFLVRDHKHRDEHDEGPMTGGLGVVGPLPIYSRHEVKGLGNKFALPLVRTTGFKGVLFPGLKGGKNSEKNLEWNARPGDPEFQVYLRMLESGLLPIIMACIEGDLVNLAEPEWSEDEHVANLVLAHPSYPYSSKEDLLVEGIEDAKSRHDTIQILHAGTKRKGSRLYTSGGRVLNIVSKASSLQQALEDVYGVAELIKFNGNSPRYRKDIGNTVLEGI